MSRAAVLVGASSAALAALLSVASSAAGWDAGSEAAKLSRDTAPATAPDPATSRSVPSGTPAPARAALPDASSQPSRTVRVVLREGAGDLDVVLAGRFANGSRNLSDRTVSVHKGNLRAADLETGSDGSALLVPLDGTSWFRLGARSYRGSLRILPQGRGCSAVNELPLEDYLAGVVPGEIGRRLDARVLEAVKAQAVVARTYAIRAMGQYGSRPWDLRDDVRDQVYEGRAGEDPLCTRAVLATAGLVLLDAAGRPVDAYYHSTSGGATADIAEVWPGKNVRSYLRGVEDTAPDGRAWGAWSPSASWSETWSAFALHAAVRRDLAEAAGRPCDPGEVVALSVSGYDPSGRARKLVVRGKRGSCEVVGDRIRWALRRPGGKGILRSTRFVLERRDASYVARGTGNGHGVGMSQTGALGRARAGQNCETILSSYYPGTVLARTGSARDATP